MTELVWKRARCDSGLCVEVALPCDMGAEQWQRFMAGIRGGWYDRMA